MGKLRSYLSQVQDFIASPITRNVMLNDLYQEALEVLFNDNKEPPTEAVVLKVYPQNQTAGDLKEGEQQFQSAVLRVPGLHDCIPDPVRLVKNSTNGEVNNCIQLHGVYFSKEPLSSVSSAESETVLLQVGDVVPIEYINGVIRFGIKKDENSDYKKLKFISEKAEDQCLAVNEQELQSKFEGREVSSVGDLVGSPLPNQAVAVETNQSSLEAASKNPTLIGQVLTNGKLPKEALSPVPGKKDRYGRDILVLTEIVNDLLALMNDFKAHFGFEMSVSSHYRSYEKQVATKKKKPKLAAKPGTSTHGWGLAIDIDTGFPTKIEKFKYVKYKEGTSGFSGDIYKWMFINAPKRGFHNPSWAQKSGSKPEAWHFEIINKKQFLEIFSAIETAQAE